MKGFFHSLFGLKVYLLICFTILRIGHVYGAGCSSLDGTTLSITIPDIPENETVNKILLDLNVNNGNLSFITTDNYLKDALKLRFNTMTKRWQIKLVKSLQLDKRKYQFMQIQLRCDDNGNSFRKDLNIAFEYRNTYIPSFISSPYHIQLNESTPVNTKVFSLNDKIEDKDYWPGGITVYNYSLEPPMPEFAIESNNVILKKKLDYDNNTRNYNFMLIAQDLGDRNQENIGSKINTTLEFKVLNVDDINLQFINRLFQVDIFENVTIGSSYEIKPKPEAVDRDNMNSKIAYKITEKPNYFDTYFEFNNPTTIKVKANLDSIPSSMIKVIIKAYEPDRPSDRYDIGFLVINVFGINKNAPEMLQPTYQASVRENALLPTLLLQVKAIDRDGNTLEYKMEPSFGEISLDNKTGSITLRKYVDPKKKRYNFQVWAEEISTSQHKKSKKSTVTIRFIDENDHSPVFSSSHYQFMINETISIKSQVGTVNATDKDDGLNGKIIYNLVGNPSFLKIDSGGIIIMTGKLTEVKDYIFMVTANDSAASTSRSTSALVEVKIRKENIFPPEFPANMKSQINLSETTPQGSIVLDVSAFDEDQDNLTYTVKPNDTFGIKSFSNSDCSFLYLKKELDAEQNIFYSLQISVTDRLHVATHILNVTVLGVNDLSPTFNNSTYRFWVKEDEPKGTLLGRVMATDKDKHPSESIKYSILGNRDFDINASSGEIRTTRTFEILGPTTFTFVVFASDNGSPKSFNTSCLVEVSIADINNHIPEFNVQSIELIVLEDKIYDLIYQPVATDKDIDPRFIDITYKIQGSTSFELKNENELYLKSNEAKNVLGQTVTVIVEAFDQAIPKKRNSITITITFKDINNNVPRFQKSPYQTRIFENSTVGSTVFKVNVSDDDVAEENKRTEFSIVDWNPQNPFFINANTGVISLWRNLDADGTQNKTFSFKVRAENTRTMDHSVTGQNFTEAWVNIQVENVNDNSPKFIQNVYLFQVNETAPLKQALFQISATDIDNDNIIYSLVGDHTPFKIDTSTGDISLSKNLDYEKESMYNFSVLATDDGQPHRSASTDVIILVKNMNNKAPTVNGRFTFSILEGQPKGTLVGCIHVSDPDGDDLIYSTNSKDFSVNSTTGELKSQTVFDFEKNNQYTILVEVTDKIHKANITVTINVINVNDHKPRFSQNEYKANLTDFKKGGSVAQVSANDDDPHDNIVYSLIGDSDFEINPNGKIVLTRNLDWKTKENSIALMATATDLKNSSTSVLVSLLLIKPLEFARSNFTTSISEAAPTGTIVFKLEPCNFVDKTVNIYNLDINLSNQSLVYYDKKCGCIRTKVLLDREVVEMQELTMEVKDWYGAHQANLTITVEDINDELPILDHVKKVIEISDDSQPGLMIIKMNATDKDKNSGFTYFLEETYGKFVIDANSGVIRTCGRFNNHLKSRYNLTVVVLDHGSPPLESNQTLSIKITDGNRCQPIFRKPIFVITINESTRRGHSIGQVNATDCDQGDNGKFIFQINQRNNKINAFAIDKFNGTVWVNNSNALDYEKIHTFNLTVEVRDSGINPKSSSAILLVNLQDINDNYPEFKSPEFVSLRLPIVNDTLLFILRAVDADSNKDGYNKIEYFQLNLNQIFRTDPETGEVWSKSKLLRTVKMYNVNFKACDKGGNCAKTSVKLSTYSDIPNIVQVNEGVQDAFVIDVNATDNDSGVFYTLTSCHEYFTINSSTGIVRTRKPLIWHPQNNRITITVVVHYSDNKSNQTEEQITVEVIDVNDHAPEFSQKSYKFQIAENVAKTFNIQATDMDGGKNAHVTYSFFPSQPQVVEGSILLNATAGTLSISSLNREDKVEYTFDIMAKDGGHPPMNSTTKVTIEVLDVNDNVPVFTKAEYNATVNENSEPQKILTVHADDKDAGLNGLVFYKLQNKSVPFTINQINGDIWSMTGLDFEKNPMYKFQILATDQGSNPKTSFCSVTINVLDICDEVPQLTTVISLSKDKIVGTSVFSLKSSENGTNYNISAEHDIVDINKKTGNVFTSSKIPNTATNYHMTVTAWSQCHLPVITKFEIKPEDPILKPDEKELKAELTENHCSNQSMFNLSSLSEFQGKDVSFKLRTFKEFFKIENGQIYCHTAVDREKYSQFELIIDVNYINKPITYTADETLKVVVTVKDVNDNQPQFQTPSLFYSIPSTAQFFYQVGKIKVIDKDDGENGASRFSLSKDDKDLFYINPSSGELHTLFNAEQSKKSEFNLQVIAIDQNGKGLESKAPLKISIYSNQFNLEMEVEKPVDFVEKILDPFIRNLSKILGFEIVVDKVQVHQSLAQNPDLQRSDILFHVLDLKNKKLVSAELVKKKMKAEKAAIDNLLHQFGMQTGQVKQVSVSQVKELHKISNSEIIIIVLACIIFVGCILGIIVAVALTRQQQKKLRDFKDSMKANSSQNYFLEMSNSAYDTSNRYNSREISVTSDDSASTNHYNGGLPNQGGAKYNHSFQGETSDSKDHKSEIPSSKDSYPSHSSDGHVENNSLSSFLLKERSETENGSMKNADSELPDPVTKEESPADPNAASDKSSCFNEDSIVADSGMASKNQNTELDTGAKSAGNGNRLILSDLHDDTDLITEL